MSDERLKLIIKRNKNLKTFKYAFLKAFDEDEGLKSLFEKLFEVLLQTSTLNLSFCRDIRHP